MFKGEQFILVTNIKAGTYANKLAYPPKSIKESWKPLSDAGFTTIDAILPMGGGIAYFFSGYKHSRVGGIDEQTTGSRHEFSDRSIDRWPSLANAKFDTVQAVLSVGDHHAYFFSGPQYIYVEGISRDTSDDRADPADLIIKGWPGLDGFW